MRKTTIVYYPMDTQTFESIARRKIAGWYSKPEYEDKAVERMSKQRTEIIDLLKSTERENIDAVIQYLDDSGFFYRASSPHKHHNWPGGLAEHSLGTCKLALSRGKDLPRDSVIIAAMLHDTCKSDRFWFKGRFIGKHRSKCTMDDSHSVRSVFLLKKCNLKLKEAERFAIRWHMKGEHYRPHDPKSRADHDKAVKTPLWHVVFWADKDDARAHPAGKRQKMQPSPEKA